LCFLHVLALRLSHGYIVKTKQNNKYYLLRVILDTTCGENTKIFFFLSTFFCFGIDEEVNWDKVRVLKDGETVSIDGTHLGHNLPDKKGSRYCINLVSVAGREQK
jgi:hypothetical protein